MALSFQEIIGLILGVVCISMVTNCTDDVKVTDEMIVTDPSAKSNVFKQVQDYTLIVENEGKTRKKRNAILGSENHWTGGIVPYSISNTFSERERRVILQSMKHWEDCTCIRFRARTNSDIYSVMFMPGVGCRSFIGRIPQTFQPQGINLGVGCVVLPVVVHEIGHALGFFHEHSREDRDNYVRVIANNILQGFDDSFEKATSDQATTLNLGYDYASIMHYSATTFARQGTSALVANDPNIPIGDAQELSPLDAAKANLLYNCSTKPLPPPSIIVPEESIVSIPEGISCGSVTKVTGPGSITSPQFPTHIFNEECAFVFEATEGYGLSIRFPQFSLDPTTDCTEDYVQIYRGASTSSSDLIRYGGFTEGRICNRDDSRLIFFATERIVTVYYRTNGRNIRSDVTGLQIAYDLRDIDECQNNRRTSRCHSCTNLPGSFECNCRDGYYHSFSANTCFDVNECAFGNGGCANTCTNLGGSYRCTCNNGLFLQADGLSCGSTPPSSIPENPTPGTIIPKHQPSLAPATTIPPPLTTPTPPMCGGRLTDSSGIFNTPNWPLTYPFNFNCVWNIILNDPNAIIEIRFDNDFGIGGQMPDCPKDQLILFDGRSTQSQQLGLFCHLTRPDPIRTNSNSLTVLFESKSSHGPTRHGFRAQYRSITMLPPTTTSPPATTSAPTTTSPPATTSAPTTTSLPATSSAPATTSPSATPPTTTPPMCGGKLTDPSGIFNTPNWPLTYPFNFNCMWNIVLNDPNAIIEIRFDDDFGIGGQMPECPKDQLILLDGGSILSQQLGVYCHLTRPDPIRTTSNRLTVLFVSLSSHGPTRHGFRAQYRAITVAPPTTTLSPATTSTPTTTSPPATTSTPAITSPPATTAAPITTSSPATTSAPTLQLPQCGGGLRKLTSLSGSLQTFNWPNSPYAVNTVCDWDIECPLGTMINILFEDSFRVAGSMPDCTKDQLTISGCARTNYGPYCHLTPPDAFSTTCNAVHVSFQAGSERGLTRTGFKLNYICTVPVVPTFPPQCGGGDTSLTAPSGSIQTLNWPDNPYPINTECSWDISCPLGVEFDFEANFRVAGRMPECNKDQLKISGCGSDYGPYCHLTPPDKIRTTCKKINVLFRSGSDRGVSRTGFKLNYQCL